jgi:hypothetical protein
MRRAASHRPLSRHSRLVTGGIVGYSSPQARAAAAAAPWVLTFEGLFYRVVSLICFASDARRTFR